MDNVPAKLFSKLDATTIRSQNAIMTRLKLFDFSKSAIRHYSEARKRQVLGHSFERFQNQFKLVSFKKDTRIKSIEYKNIVKTGDAFIEGELADSTFILNMATFEHWVISTLKALILSNPRKLFPKSKKQIEVNYLKKYLNIDELWEELVDDYVIGLPYKGLKETLKTFLRSFGLKESQFTGDVIAKLNENSLCRNLIVHNNKRVNAAYTHKCGKFAKFTEGQQITITESVLFEQGDNILRFTQDFRKSHE